MAEARRLGFTEGEPLCLSDAYQLQGEGEKQTIIVWEDLETQEILKEPVIVWEDLETHVIVWEDLETQEILKEPVIAWEDLETQKDCVLSFQDSFQDSLGLFDLFSE